MKISYQRIKQGFLISLGVTLLLLPIISISEEQISNNHPPPFVECRIESKCDSDIEELKQFLMNFYKWYVINEDEIFLPQYRNLTGKEHKKFRLKHEKNTNEVLKKYLTPSFYAWRKKVLSSEYASLPKHPKYCWSDTNTITCTQDYDLDWFLNMKIEVTEIYDKRTIFNITLIDSFNISYELIVTLKVVEGVWRIDAVDRAY